MHDVSKEYFQHVIDFSYSARQGESSFSYNPLTTDNPFYNVYVSENVKIINDSNHREVQASRAMRIVESLDLVEKAIKRIQANEIKWNDYAKKNLNGKNRVLVSQY